ncbi:unnamed protein product [Anisakis simplex]|uniref:Uncharacterized protein n=1 Tax=Anisakis simplex TaxID=6269 RepID=A0A0M3JQ13_ANISI|nr:unnamed protein product [Anisakis simplex]
MARTSVTSLAQHVRDSPRPPFQGSLLASTTLFQRLSQNVS